MGRGDERVVHLGEGGNQIKTSERRHKICAVMHDGNLKDKKQTLTEDTQGYESRADIQCEDDTRAVLATRRLQDEDTRTVLVPLLSF